MQDLSREAVYRRPEDPCHTQKDIPSRKNLKVLSKMEGTERRGLARQCSDPDKGAVFFRGIA